MYYYLKIIVIVPWIILMDHYQKKIQNALSNYIKKPYCFWRLEIGDLRARNLFNSFNMQQNYKRLLTRKMYAQMFGKEGI